MAHIKIGTSGYSYTEWVGVVYPAGSKQKDFLSVYAGMFPTVELNFSYYAMPEPENLAKMLVDGGERLTFSIKAHKTLTHEVNPSEWQNEVKTYLEAIEPLRDAERLEAVLFEFPPSFHYIDDNRRYLDSLLKCFSGVPSVVEFRCVDWYNAKMFEGMKSRGIPLVSLDLPEIRGNPPQTDVLTSSTAYIRFHGRNKEAWWGSQGSARYDYMYTDEEIEAWAGRIQGLAEQAQRILVYFNNHPNGKAARNAQTLEKMLRKMGLMV